MASGNRTGASYAAISELVDGDPLLPLNERVSAHSQLAVWQVEDEGLPCGASAQRVPAMEGRGARFLRGPSPMVMAMVAQVTLSCRYSSMRPSSPSIWFWAARL